MQTVRERPRFHEHFPLDLQSLDGIACLVDQLTSSDERASLAAHVIGVAASNNPTFQNHLLVADPEILSKLIKV